MLLNSLVLTMALAAAPTYPQTVRSAFPALREYRNMGLERRTPADEDARICLTRIADEQRVCKTRAGWKVEAAAISRREAAQR
jgi:hypothetical protein